MKNILIVGPPRTGKSTLANEFKNRFGYKVIEIDKIVDDIRRENPSLGISHSSDADVVSSKISSILLEYLTNSSGYVIEGTHISLGDILPYLSEKDVYIVGLLFKNMDINYIFDNIRKTEDSSDWTFWVDDIYLKKSLNDIVLRNKYFEKEFHKYNVISYYTDGDRDLLFDDIINDYIANSDVLKK